MSEGLARSRFRLRWILVIIGLPAMAIAGRWVFFSARPEAVHPTATSVQSIARPNPAARWDLQIQQARRDLKVSLTEQNLPGLSVAVGIGGELAWAEGFGWADLKTSQPVTPDTRFRIGTLSMMLTAASVGALLDKGQLKLDDEIQQFVPEFPKKQWPVTVRQLMGHTGGLGNDGGDESPLFRQRCERPIEAIPHFAQNPLVFEPGTQYRYSKYGWILASAAVEAAAKQPFRQFLDEQIFKPVGMANTGAQSSTEENREGVGEEGEDAPPITFVRQMILEPLGVATVKALPAAEPATIYARGFGHNPVLRNAMHEVSARNLSCYAGALAFYSTPSDLVRFGLSLSGGKLLRPQTVDLLQTPQKLASGEKTGHGLGWDEYTAAGGTLVSGGNGELSGQSLVTLMIFRESGAVVAIVSNMSTDTSALAVKVAEAFKLRATL